MKLYKVTPYGMGSNSYILTADDKTAVVIDPSSSRVKDKLFSLHLVPAYVLLTHCHFDHVVLVPELQQMGAKVYTGENEKELVGTRAALSALFGAPDPDYSVNGVFEDGEEKTLCGIKVKAIFTAGHTQGSVTYLVTDEKGNRSLFTGDTLFEGSIGRTDFPTGSVSEIRASLRRLRELEGDYPVYSGHGEDTTLETERRANPFLCDL